MSVLLNGPSDSVYDVAWMPDGNGLASAGRDGTLRVWRAGGDKDTEFNFSTAVLKVAFSHGGRFLVIGTHGGLVEVRDTSSWNVVFTRHCAGLESLLVLREPAMILAGGTDGFVHGWPLGGGSEVQYQIGGPALSIRASPDETWLAIASRGRVLFLASSGGDCLATFEPGDRVEVYDCAIAADGETVAAAMRIRRDGNIGRTERPDLFEIAVWRPRRGEQPAGKENLIGHVSWITSVEFSPRATLLASASFDTTVRVWDYVRLKQVVELRGHGAAVYSARFSPGGDRLATCSADGQIRIWRVADWAGGSKQALVLREPSTPRQDGVGVDPLLMRAECLSEELIAIRSPKLLRERILNTVAGTDRELGLALQQIVNVRAEQARREHDRDAVRDGNDVIRRWRMLQSEVQRRGFEFALGLMFFQRAVPSTPPFLDRLSKLGKGDLARIRRTADSYVELLMRMDGGALSIEAGCGQLMCAPIDERALFMAAARLEESVVAEVVSGRRNAGGLTHVIEMVTAILPPHTDRVAAAELFQIAGILRSLSGDNEAAVAWFERAVAAAREGGWPQQLSGTLGNLGNGLHNVGRLNDATVAYEECLDIATRERLRDEFVTHSLNLANIAEELGDHHEAYSHFRNAAGVCEFALNALPAGSVDRDSELEAFAGTARRYSSCLYQLAAVYREFGDDEGEAEAYLEAYRAAEQLRDYRIMAASLGGLADIDRRMGRHESAEARYRTSYAIAERLGNADGQVHVLGGQALLRESAGNLTEAQELRAAAVKIAREHGLRKRLIVELCNLADVLVHEARYSDAEAALLEANAVAHRTRRELRVPEEGPAIQESVAGLADRLIRLYLLTGRPTDAFEAAERARAGVLLRQLRRTGPHAGGSYSAVEILQALRRVGHHAVLVSYYLLRDRVCAFVLRADEEQPHACESPLAVGELEAIRLDFERQVVRGDAPTQREESWLRLARLAIDPVRDHLRDQDLLILSPHGLLQGLPLHALLVDGDRLLGRWAVAYVPSASAFAAMAAQPMSPVQRCAVLGAHFTQEAAAVAEILGVRPVGGAEVDKDFVLRALTENDIVHLSTHGFYADDYPRRSGLILRPSRQVDEYKDMLCRPLSTTWSGMRLELSAAREQLNSSLLEADDLASTKSRARLVTMSACETGLVRTDPADDPVGLVPALLTAGVHSVVATLWKVDAVATVELMREFYSALTQPGGWSRIPHALRDAAAAVRARHPHPYTWAPALLVGGIGEGTAD